ncbi:MAG: HAMP domain-containing histidine kinase [Bacteroidetes bacterium]|nr:HAMP domain-containing histidine kinase [Bacteroidota bacterium]
MKRTYKLLTKSTLVYLVITFLVFLLSAQILQHFLEKYIDDELEFRFNRWERRITHHISEENDLQEILGNDRIQLLSSVPLPGSYPVYVDTLLHNDEMDALEPWRIKKIVVEKEQHFLEVTMKTGMNELVFLRGAVYNTLFPAFILLALIVVLSNRFMSGYLLKPFNKILSYMETYSVGEKLESVKTNTSEFRSMQELFHNMISRIEEDYKNLKEYTENMSHELQTPLSVLRRKIELLLGNEKIMDSEPETIKTLYEEVNHISNLGTSLNLLTKIENKEFLNLQRVKTKNVIENHLAKINEVAELKSLTINSDLSDSHELTIDPILFDILLTNLVKNALKYSDLNTTITLASSRDELVISNYGKSLNVKPELIFERFYTSESSSNSLGLGLSIVKKICELNSISIEYSYEKEQHYFRLRQ